MVMRSNEPITILKLVANEKASLPPKERSRVRALVHRFCSQVEAGKDLDLLMAELPRVRGQVYKVKRFHPTKGLHLAARVDEAARVLRAAQDRSLGHGEASVTVGPLPSAPSTPAPWDE